jgi:Ca2+-binding RTX toxin-like protein
MTAGRRRTVTALAALALAALPTTTALSAGSAVPGSLVTRYQVAITADRLKPAACAGITLTAVRAGVTGTNSAELLLGTAGADTMSARGGTDCVLGGGGTDSINCGAGTDIALGGPGTDTFNSNCETRIQ